MADTKTDIPRDNTLALLCGGRSERLGSDKGLFKPTGDESLVRRALRIFASQFKSILIVVHDDNQKKLYEQEVSEHFWPSVSIIKDSTFGKSNERCALSGVHSALQASKTKRVAVLPIDQVGVSPAHFLKLFGNSTGSDCFSTSEGPLPFPAVFTDIQKESVAAALDSGQYSVRSFHKEVESRIVESGDLKRSLEINCNTVDEMTAFFGKPLFDSYDRRLHYLRFSLTEACNLSCTYCLPDGFPEWLRHKSTLNLDAIKNVLVAFRSLGFRKVRFTGGEPTVHKKCLEAVRFARDLGFESIAITTNALLIKNLNEWREAGLSLLNVSLDTLNEDEFFNITKNRNLKRVTDLVDEACSVGLEVKTNAVLLRSVNGHEKNICDMIDWAISRPMTLRFIELMNTGLNSSFAAQERVLGSEIVPHLMQRGFAAVDTNKDRISIAGPATDFFSSAYPGKVGLINPMSCNFCDRCNRLRVTARGGLKMCLFGDNDVPFDLTSVESIADTVRSSIVRKQERHHLESGVTGNVSTFRTIGG